MTAYGFLFAILIIIAVSAVFLAVLTKKHPPYISENDARHDTVSVYVWTNEHRGRRVWDYREYLFVRRKNGKYRLRLRPYDVLCIVIPMLGLAFGAFIISLFIDKFIEQPETIPALVGFFLLLIFYVFVANYPRLEAIVYFRKNMKKFCPPH
ncbi:MAG: hypothetical protein K5869_10240 [Saccharofermentans sp.]|nr:hypothetical protein [Saccharofermentans sp.]